MRRKEINLISKGLLIIAIVFALISCITPWNVAHTNINGNDVNVGSLYNFGMSFQEYNSFDFSDSKGEMHYYFQLVTEDNSFLNTDQFSNSEKIPFFLSIFVLPLMLLGLYVLSGSLVKQNKGIENADSLLSAVFISVSLIFFYSFIQFGFGNLMPASTGFFNYSIGFYAGIFAAVASFCSFFVNREYLFQEETTQESNELSENEPLDIIKKRYAQGEISKEEFQELKDELKD